MGLCKVKFNWKLSLLPGTHLGPSIFLQANAVQYRLIVRDVKTLQILQLYTCLDAIQYIEVNIQDSQLSSIFQGDKLVELCLICSYINGGAAKVASCKCHYRPGDFSFSGRGILSSFCAGCTKEVWCRYVYSILSTNKQTRNVRWLAQICSCECKRKKKKKIQKRKMKLSAF